MYTKKTKDDDKWSNSILVHYHVSLQAQLAVKTTSHLPKATAADVPPHRLSKSLLNRVHLTFPVGLTHRVQDLPPGSGRDTAGASRAAR